MNDDARYMAPLHLAARLILENGGETYRVEETVTRMGHAFGFEEVEAFAVPSGIVISYRKGATDLTRVDAVNAISRQMEAEQLTCEEVMERLIAVESRRAQLTKWQLMLALGLSSGGWAVMFGGAGWDAVVAFVVSTLAQGVAYLLDRARMRSFVGTLTGCFLGTILPMFFHMFTGLLVTDACIAACLMPMLPGLAMTNAVQDTMRGDMVSGIASAFSAVLTAAMVAGGALIGTTVFRLLTGGAL